MRGPEPGPLGLRVCGPRGTALHRPGVPGTCSHGTGAPGRVSAEPGADPGPPPLPPSPTSPPPPGVCGSRPGVCGSLPAFWGDACLGGRVSGGRAGLRRPGPRFRRVSGSPTSRTPPPRPPASRLRWLLGAVCGQGVWETGGWGAGAGEGGTGRACPALSRRRRPRSPRARGAGPASLRPGCRKEGHLPPAWPGAATINVLDPGEPGPASCAADRAPRGTGRGAGRAGAPHRRTRARRPIPSGAPGTAATGSDPQKRGGNRGKRVRRGPRGQGEPTVSHHRAGRSRPRGPAPRPRSEVNRAGPSGLHCSVPKLGGLSAWTGDPGPVAVPSKGVPPATPRTPGLRARPPRAPRRGCDGAAAPGRAERWDRRRRGFRAHRVSGPNARRTRGRAGPGRPRAGDALPGPGRRWPPDSALSSAPPEKEARVYEVVII